MKYVLGIDLGTSSLKASLYTTDGKFINSFSDKYSLISEKKGYSEQNPNDWVKACFNVLDKLNENIKDFSENLLGISFSGQMHSLVTLDENKEVLRNAILWNDVRTTKQCKEITDKLGKELINITKNIALEGFTLPKILWLQENEPELWNKVRYIMMPKDYLGYILSGNIFTDYSDAAGTLLLDLNTNTWSNKILETFNISKEILPNLYHSQDEVGILKEEIKSRYNFKNDVKIFAGGADNAMAATASGILNDKTALLSIGTSGVFLSIEDKVTDVYNGKMHLFNHALKNHYYSMGVTLSAGNSLEWFKNTFAKDSNFDELLKSIDKIEIGSNNLLFSPYITGERTPYADSNIRGSFIGIDINHNLSHFSRSVIEGITFSLRDVKELIYKNTGKKFNNIISVGGASKNKVWLQIQADIFNANILCLESKEGPGLGAAMIACLGLGIYDDIEKLVKDFVKIEEIFKPIEENVNLYNKVYENYKKIYNQTKIF